VKIPRTVQIALWPASLLWQAIVRTRAAAYRKGFFRSKRLPGTVISVGNLTAGGTGKTPLVLWLAERLHAEGKRAAVLTRGYRGVPAGPGGVPQSDEVAIYRTRLQHLAELGVGANRFASGKILSRHGIEWFVLDDGFQHMQLARDVDIVLLDATDPFAEGWMIPAGLLREPKSALARADIIIVTRSPKTPAIETIVQRITHVPIFHAVTELLDVVKIPTHPSQPPEPLAGWRTKKAFAFCGIGNPQAFFDDLSRWGGSVSGHSSFPDHHTYTQRDIQRLESDARDSAAEIMLCTEKDIFNLRNVQLPRLPVYCARISMEISEPDKLWRTISETAERHRKPASD
jgi:tetraacyldisaccharide 4'-kinase